MSSSENDFSIYIHIPFCKQACSYCDFYFVTRQNLINDYVDALLNEITGIKALIEEVDRKSNYPEGSPSRLRTIYFGGGTPSRLTAKEVSDIVQALERQFGFEHITEVTFEMNPDDVNPTYLSDLKSIGVNRLSMGVQSFDPALLSFMNRAHTAEEALRSLEMVKFTEFNSYSVDLIYGNPGQSNDTLLRDLELLTSFDPPHVSAYALTIEPNTRLGKYSKMGRIQPMDDSNVTEHMILVKSHLEQNGINRYEVSNFAKPGCESQHNSGYWNHVPYIGLGPGGHSLWHYSDSKKSLIRGAFRWENPKDLKSYISKVGRFDTLDFEAITSLQLSEERLLMGLRTKNGVALRELQNRYDYKLSDKQIAWLNDPMNQSLISIEDESIRITDSGIPIADRLILELATQN